MANEQKNILKIFSFRRIIIPVILGILVAFLLIWRDRASLEMAIKTLPENWTWFSTISIALALCMMLIRDLAYMWRIRLLTDKKLSWRQSFQVIMMWEFASALTPSVVGGSAVALFIVSAEGIPGGKSTAIVLITSLLDELFYIIFVPLVILLAGAENLFNYGHQFSLLGTNFSFKYIFLIGYAFILILTTLIIFGVFVKPHWFKKILHLIFSWKPLRRWLRRADRWGDEIVTTSNEMKNKSFGFWVKMFFITSFSWTARFAVVNFLIWAINPAADYFMVYARQLVMWVVLLISPTPGGSGLAEFAFPIFLGDFIPSGLASPLAVLWRLMSYYPYFIIGAIVLPIWLRRVLSKK